MFTNLSLNAKALADKITARAAIDKLYNEELQLWFKGQRSTVHLRDVLAAPFSPQLHDSAPEQRAHFDALAELNSELIPWRHLK